MQLFFRGLAGFPKQFFASGGIAPFQGDFKQTVRLRPCLFKTNSS